MSVAAVEPTAQGVVNVQKVQKIVMESTLRVIDVMVQIFPKDPESKPDFKELAEKEINQNLDGELANLSSRMTRAYNTLYEASLVCIQLKSQNILLPLLEKIKTETGDQDADRKLLGSFVLSETQAMADKLDNETPGASLEDIVINWES
ncbi:MAG: hypothetical protein WB791_09170 [Waddliaceae bacterium]